MSEKMIESIKRYLDDVYGNMECIVSINKIDWFKNGKKIASITTEFDSDRLRLCSDEFYMFLNIFSLPWKTKDDDKFLLGLITPYLKFNGGSPAIPILKDMGIITELTVIGLPDKM